jgi:two-component system, NtrC family, response regulator HydG
MKAKDTPLHAYNYILENMVDGLFTVDTSRVITYWNKAAEDILGFKKEEVIGRHCDVLESPTCMGPSAPVSEGCCALFASGRVVRKRCIVTAKDGSKKYLLKNARLLRDEQGTVIGGVENIIDISQQVAQEEEIQRLKQEMKGRTCFLKIIGTHYKMQNIYDLLDLTRESSSSVLIFGESGTGKELIAHALHYSSQRAKKPFVKVNCAALAETLLESELFGHVKGAFTDAFRDRKGRFEEAHGGTIFLDEIGDLPLTVQTKLLRVIQDRIIERVGDNRPVKTDVRIIAATNKDLTELMHAGKFREDLFYRINVVPIRVPPLRERATDIPLLVEHFMDKFSRLTGKCVARCNPDALAILMKYDWPGNVRELENTIEYAFVTCRSDCIKLHNLPEQVIISSQSPQQHASRAGRDLDEKVRIVRALEMTRGNRTKAAVSLGLSRVSLWKKIKKYNLSE